jgi:hypothetical protein
MPALSNTMPVVSATAGLSQTADPVRLAFAMAVTGHEPTFRQPGIEAAGARITDAIAGLCEPYHSLHRKL